VIEHPGMKELEGESLFRFPARMNAAEREDNFLASLRLFWSDRIKPDALKCKKEKMVVDDGIFESLNVWALLGMRVAALAVFWQVARALKALAKANSDLTPLEKLVRKIEQIGSFEPGFKTQRREKKEDDFENGRVN
jgi:hypothetical protein